MLTNVRASPPATLNFSCELLRLLQQLKAEPRHHWVLTRISSEYYEQRKYALALKYAEKAFAQVPSCPLVMELRR
jgi:hypothetical protein